MGFKLDARSEKILSTVKPELQAVVKRAAETSKVPFVVVSGLRTVAQQKALYSIGRRGRPGEKPITWTLKSNHMPCADGTGHAIDFSLVDKAGKPSNTDPKTWKVELWKPVAEAMKAAGKELGYPVEWMMDLHPHLGDLGHIQLIKGSRH